MMNKEFITIVSGLPRSGTSMVMQMLEAGGLKPLSDELREADEDNPRGYYEFEPVKQTAKDAAWVPLARGKVVKIIYRLLYDLPKDQQYRVIFMQRNMEEIIASQNAMLERRGQRGGGLSDENMAKAFEGQLAEFEEWIASQPCFSVLYVKYKDALEDPLAQSERISSFLGGGLDTAAMAEVVDPSLYRKRR
jgi:hypothetical protein